MVTADPGVRGWAEMLGIAVLPLAVDLVNAQIGEFDWPLSVANLRILRDAVLALRAKGQVNFHDGPLPRYAGLNMPAWAVINDEAQHAASWHMLQGGVDEGDLLAQVMIDIAFDETGFSLNSKCYATGKESFGSVMTPPESRTLQRAAQDLSKRSYIARDSRPAGFGRIDFARGTGEICALVRGLDFGGYANPLIVPKIEVDGRILTVSQAEAVEGQGGPGVVIAASAETLTVGTSDGTVRLAGFGTLDSKAVMLPRGTCCGAGRSAGAGSWRGAALACSAVTKGAGCAAFC